jgi:hypothetical protein
MRNLLIITALLLCVQAYTKDRYYTKNGKITFFSSAPLEDIEASNNQVAAYIELPAGTIKIAVLIKSFQFEKALMQEHFNENYMNSDKYPKATFDGLFVDTKPINPAIDDEYYVKVRGELTIKGITNDLETKVLLKIKDGKINATSEFIIRLADFNMAIPNSLKNNISENVLVKVDVTLTKFEPNINK